MWGSLRLAPTIEERTPSEKPCALHCLMFPHVEECRQQDNGKINSYFVSNLVFVSYLRGMLFKQILLMCTLVSFFAHLSGDDMHVTFRLSENDSMLACVHFSNLSLHV